MNRFITVLTFVASEPAAAQTAEVIAERRAEPSALVAADGGVGVFAREGMTTVHGLVLAEDPNWRVLVEARLRLRTFGKRDGDPTIRREDWDEPSDVAHVLRELTYRDDGVSVRAGELADASLGHGTIVRGYHNALDPDHPHAGLLIDVQQADADLQAMVDNYLAPRLVGGRAAVRPFDDRLTLGATAAFDLSAPDTIVEEFGGDRAIDSTRNLRTEGGVLGMAGADVEFLFGERNRGWLAPYVDTNVLVGMGAGLHAGAHASLPAGRLRLRLQGEYRLGTNGYAPAYADALYDLERLQFSLGRPGQDPSPKRTVVDGGGFGGQGFLAEAGLGNGSFEAAASLSHRPGIEGNLMSARLLMPLGRRTRLSLWGHHRGIGETGTDGLMAAGGLRVRLSDHVFALGEYARLWQLQDDGIYRPEQIAFVSLGLSQPL